MSPTTATPITKNAGASGLPVTSTSHTHSTGAVPAATITPRFSPATCP